MDETAAELRGIERRATAAMFVDYTPDVAEWVENGGLPPAHLVSEWKRRGLRVPDAVIRGETT